MFNNISQINLNNVSASRLSAMNKVDNESAKSSYAQTPIKRSYSNPAFMANIPAQSAVRTKLITEDEIQKYNTLTKNLDKQGKKSLDFLLKTGILLSNKSNDKTTTLDSLYKIATTKRAEGLDNISLLKDTVTTIADPYIITQQFGDITPDFKDKAVNAQTENSSNLLKRYVAQHDIDVQNSGCCVSASIEFNLANKMPAEFARVAEGLTSPNLTATKDIKTKNLTDNALDAVWLLNAFEIPYEMKNFDEATVKLSPDKNAIIRAQLQTKHKDPQERSALDVLMQSTFMNVGSQQTYNSLTDRRAGKFSQENRGLIEFEKTFTESVVEDKNKTSATYQVIDDNETLVGYETDFATIKKHITDALKQGENVIIGYTQTDANNKIINGHEITIVDTRVGNDGKTIFICNDTDDDNPNPIEYTEDYLIPKIHHAGLPQNVVKDDIKYTENWIEGMNTFNEMRKNQA